MLHWRPPQWDPDLLADLFAAPPALAFLYEHTQRQVQDTGRLLGKKVHASWRALSYVGPQSSRAITVLRVDPDTYGDLAKLDYPVQVHHEWRCFSLPQSYAQSLCLLEGSDLAWVDARAQALDLEALARARDLGSDAGIEEFRTVIETEPAPSLVAMSRAPLLHWELQEDPAQLLWTLSAYGQPDAQGLPGWKGVMRMGFASAVSQEAAKTLKSAKLLQSDATIAAQLRAKAHIAPLSDRSLEIRLEQHADAPAQP